MSAHATPAGAPCWIELLTDDPHASSLFYTELFGWHVRPHPAAGHLTMAAADEPVAAMGPRIDDSPDAWIVLFSVPDAAAATRLIRRHGGVVHTEPAGTALGRIAIATDPHGARFAVWEAGEFASMRIGGTNRPAYHELHSTDLSAAARFYENVLDWDLTEHVESRYRYWSLDHGLHGLAGILDASESLPPQGHASWQVYVEVADVTDTLTAGVRLGGSIIEPAVRTPFGVLGRLADRTGATVKLIAA